MTTLLDFLALLGLIFAAALAVVVAVVGYCIIADAVRDRRLDREIQDLERTLNDE